MSNEVTEKLLARLNERKKIFMVPTKLRGRYAIRFAICARTTEPRHIDEAWEEIKSATEEILDLPKASKQIIPGSMFRQQS